MRLGKLALVGTVLLLLVAVFPLAGASPVRGVVTTCVANWSCDFVLTSPTGTGWANTTSTGTLTLRLPGEAVTSTNLTYSTAIQATTSNYSAGNTTYWTVGTFLGTDWNTGNIVYGTTNSNFTVTCHHVFRWCHDTYTTNNGSIVVKFTRAEPTSTSFSCSPTSINIAAKTKCTVTVHNLWNSTNYPVGKLHFLSSGGGTFANKGTCSLSSTGACSFTWQPADDTCGSSTLTATYGGTAYYYKSSGAMLIGVTGGC